MCTHLDIPIHTICEKCNVRVYEERYKSSTASSLVLPITVWDRHPRLESHYSKALSHRTLTVQFSRSPQSYTLGLASFLPPLQLNSTLKMQAPVSDCPCNSDLISWNSKDFFFFFDFCQDHPVEQGLYVSLGFSVNYFLA